MTIRSELFALFQVILIDITLAGDNAVVVAMAVQGLNASLRRRAIVIGIAAATVAISLLAILGLTLAGGILLLWVCWKMWRDLRGGPETHTPAGAGTRSLTRVVLRIVLADLSMSLDNVLAVAGAARAHIWIMAAGLALSILLMGVAADLLARALQRYRWIAWLGLASVLYVALDMVARGWGDVAPYL
jgi:YjbE family integral membrane protein